MLESLSSRNREDRGSRDSGPLSFRFPPQPAMPFLLEVRSGLKNRPVKMSVRRRN
jgi:hypothetical protein